MSSSYCSYLLASVAGGLTSWLAFGLYLDQLSAERWHAAAPAATVDASETSVALEVKKVSAGRSYKTGGNAGGWQHRNAMEEPLAVHLQLWQQRLRGKKTISSLDQSTDNELVVKGPS